MFFCITAASEKQASSEKRAKEAQIALESSHRSHQAELEQKKRVISKLENDVQLGAEKSQQMAEDIATLQAELEEVKSEFNPEDDEAVVLACSYDPYGVASSNTRPSRVPSSPRETSPRRV